VYKCGGCPNCNDVNNGCYVCMHCIECDLVWASGAIVCVVLCMSVDHVLNCIYHRLL
jgi:hypothetical protein